MWSTEPRREPASLRFPLMVSKTILQEFLRVLAYPKFDLSSDEIEGLIGDEDLKTLGVLGAAGFAAVRYEPASNPERVG